MGTNKVNTERGAEMRMKYSEGMGIKALSSQHNVSRQRVYQICRRKRHERFSNRTYISVSRVIYPNIRKWILENNMGICEFRERIGITCNCKILYIEKPIEMKTIRKILEVTGMTFEEAFEKEDAKNV